MEREEMEKGRRRAHLRRYARTKGDGEVQGNRHHSHGQASHQVFLPELFLVEEEEEKRREVSAKRRLGTLRKLCGESPTKCKNGGAKFNALCGAAAFVTRPRVVGGL